MRMIPTCRRPRRRLAVAALLLPLGLGGCAAQADQSRPQVVTAFYPLQFVAQRVAGDDASVENLTEPGAEPHDLELTVPQVVDMAGADVIVLESGFQAAVDEARTLAVEGSDPPRVVDAARTAGLVGDDPHFWLDPTRLARLVGPAARALSAADPRHAAAYRSRATALRDDLARLDADLRRGLAHCAQHEVVVSHDAFGYLGRRYHLDVVPIAGVSPDAEPSPDRLADLADVVRRTGVSTVFAETLTTPALARTLADEVGVRTDVLDPLEGLTPTEAAAGADYLSVMRDNLDALRRAGGCR